MKVSKLVLSLFLSLVATYPPKAFAHDTTVREVTKCSKKRACITSRVGYSTNYITSVSKLTREGNVKWKSDRVNSALKRINYTPRTKLVTVAP